MICFFLDLTHVMKRLYLHTKYVELCESSSVYNADFISFMEINIFPHRQYVSFSTCIQNYTVKPFAFLSLCVLCS